MPTITTLPQKVLLISNLPTTGELWAFSLQQENLTVILENDSLKAISRWNEEIPDLVIIDLKLPHNEIIQLIERLRNETVMPVILLSQYLSDDEVLEAYKAGVDECIQKPFNPAIFIAKIKVWLQRSWSVPIGTLDTLHVGRIMLHPAERTVQIDGKEPIRLTNLELRLTYSLMTKADRTLGSNELIQQIWGYSADGNHVTLKNLVYRLRRKIEENPTRPRMIKTVANSGYKLISE